MTPATTFGNWFSPVSRRQVFAAAITSLNTISLAVVGESAPFEQPFYSEETLASVRRKLVETEEVARRQGYAVAIGHPHDVTLQALAEWLPTLQAKGLALAPITAILRKRNSWD